MNKQELIKAMSTKAVISKKDSEKALKAFEEVITETLAGGGKVQLVGFGTFKVSERAERNGVNPSTGEPITIPAAKAPKFQAGQFLKDAVNKA